VTECSFGVAHDQLVQTIMDVEPLGEELRERCAVEIFFAGYAEFVGCGGGFLVGWLVLMSLTGS
jgi:hypothetical protein